MSIFYDTTFSVHRLKQLDGYRSAYSSTLTAYKGSFQSIQDDQIQQNAGKVGQTFQLYADIKCEMEEGDIAVVSGVKYSVRGKGEYKWIGGTLNHNRYVVVREQE